MGAGIDSLPLKPMKNITLLLIFLLALCASPVQAQAAQPVVRAVMFWMDGCPHCEDVIQNVLPPLHEKYGAQFDLFMIEVKGQQDVDLLYRVAASYKFTKEQTGVPFLIIGDQALVGSDQVREQLPALIDDYLTRGGLDFPANPLLADLLPTTSPASLLTSDLPAVTQAVPSPEAESTPPVEEVRNNGFTLAAVVMIFMIVAILYALFCLLTGKLYFQAAWMDAAIPWFALIGLGVAAYLLMLRLNPSRLFADPWAIATQCNPVPMRACGGFCPSVCSALWGISPSSPPGGADAFGKTGAGSPVMRRLPCMAWLYSAQSSLFI